MIRSFVDPDTEALFRGRQSKRLPPDIQRTAQRKLHQLNAAERLNDLKAPPGNKLRALARDRLGQHAIWINSQWRICFVWTDAGPERVEITDYHD